LLLKTAFPPSSVDNLPGGEPIAEDRPNAQLRALVCRNRYVVLLILCLGLYLPGLFTIPTIDRDEAYFAQASKQMLVSGDFVIPHYLKKPHRKTPGIYWLQALSVKYFGGGHQNTIWPYRLPSVAGATAAALLTCWIGTLTFEAEVGLLAGALFAASLLTVGAADMARPDAALLACVTLAQGCVAALYCSAAHQHRRRFFAAAFWVAQGLGILIKGPVLPFVSASTIGGLWLLDRYYRRGGAAADASNPWIRSLLRPWAILLAAAIVMPWLAALAFDKDRLLYAHALSNDFFPKLMAGVESHWGPPLYYVLLAAVMFWPGSLFLGTAVSRLWRARQASAGLRLCVAWLVPTWVAAELIPTKLPHYVLPAYPALAILVAWAVSGWRNSPPRRLERIQAGAWAAVTVGLGAAALALVLVMRERVGLCLILLVVFALATALVCGTMAWRGRLESAAWLSVAGALMLFGLLRVKVLPGLDNFWLSRKVSAAVTALRINSIATVGYGEPSLAFALWPGLTVTNVGASLDFLDTRCDRATLVDGDYAAEFLAFGAARKVQLRPVWSGRGFDYSNGRWVSLTLYQSDICRKREKRNEQ
jgi:4-amino-4-deoxy-L-arabinose transferase-like glycosyltransferase